MGNGHSHLTEDFNIMFLGPTGAGKSTLIKHLYNRTVCQTDGAAKTTPRQAGSGSFEGKMGKTLPRRTKVNVIDTIGKRIAKLL